MKNQAKMSVVKYHTPTEVRKFLRGRKTKLDPFCLLHSVGPQYLEMLKILEGQTGEQRDIEELRRMFRLEDPRGPSTR